MQSTRSDLVSVKFIAINWFKRTYHFQSSFFWKNCE